MSRDIKTIALICSALGGLSAASVATAQEAAPKATDVSSPGQQPTSAGEFGGEIIVTAQKRDERLIDVPTAVTSVAASSLIDQNLVQMTDYAARIPGLQVSGGRTENISLRGITTGGLSNPSVATLIDDIPYGSSTYLGRAPIPDLDPGTLERIEVLRGPQGTLYGASSLGGLVKFVTKEPSTKDFSGRAEIGANMVEDGGEGWSARASLNIPIMADRIGLSVSGFYRNDPRWIDTLAGGAEPDGRVGPGPVTGGTLFKNANKNENWGGRVALLLRPVDGFTVTLAAVRQKGDSRGGGATAICSLCGTTDLSEVTFDRRYSNVNLRTVVGLSPFAGGSTRDLGLYSVRMNLELGDHQITSISAWGRNRETSLTDGSFISESLDVDLGFPGTPVYATPGDYQFGAPISTNKFSQEIRISTSNSVFDYIAGVFYTTENSLNSEAIFRRGPAPIVTVYEGRNRSSYKEKAVFGSATLHATDKLDLQIGARYGDNKQTYDVQSIIDPVAQPVLGPNEQNSFRSKENIFTWLISPSYHFTPDVMGYLRVANGYRPGGPNTQTPGAEPTFDSDTVINYEAGLKGYFLNRAVTLDATIFQIDWKDIQLQNTSLPSQFLFFVNGNKARARGMELAATVRPTKGLSIDGNFTILDAKLTEDLDRSTEEVQRLFGQAGDRLPSSAKFTANIGAQQSVDLSGSTEGYLGFNLTYVGSRLGPFNQDTPDILLQRPVVPSYTSLDLRAGLTIQKTWKLNVYVRNLFDEKGFESVGTSNGTQPRATAELIQPRTIGFTASVDF